MIRMILKQKLSININKICAHANIARIKEANSLAYINNAKTYDIHISMPILPHTS